MKIVYGCYPSFFSRLIANKLIEHDIPVTHIMLSTKALKIEGNSGAQVKTCVCIERNEYLCNRFILRYDVR